MLLVHETDPTQKVEEAYFRIRITRMAGVGLCNDALVVEAVDFQRWQGHWLGVVITPWQMSALLLPGQAEGWQSVSDNQRRFVKFPAGDFAFLGGEEPELGEYQSCPLFSPMDRFASQADAVLTARAALLAMLRSPEPVEPTAPEPKAKDQPSLSRRRFFGLR